MPDFGLAASQQIYAKSIPSGSGVWQNWRSPVTSATDDTFMTVFSPANYAVLAAAVPTARLDVSGYAAVAVRLAGLGAAAKVADFQILHWGDSGSSTGQCVALVGLQGRCTLGAHVLTAEAFHPDWSADAWRDADSIGSGVFGSGQGSNACGARIRTGGGTAMLIVPTLGHAVLTLELNLAAAEAADQIGAIWRPMSLQELAHRHGEEQLTPRVVVVHAGISAQNTWTPWGRFIGQFRASMSGNSGSTFRIQVSNDGGTTPLTVQDSTAAAVEVDVDAPEHGAVYRAGVPTGGYVAGTLIPRLSQ